ncbi:ABC transporter substrate-binding protein [Enterococcus asini]|uniref:ABC transporter substrate-binding protein n=1 Tax=Enterococcus asini TaxID=57732 RepID=A0AAW8TU76_9ENTE|nr:ABC transporter substrate-binding protein [Enterococcus asini]MDT2809831.1 ABC transporter substrate-binding protein [Enterococcus asini]
MKKWMTTMGLLALAVMTLGACGNEGKEAEKTAATSDKEVETLTLGVMPSTDNIPLILAHEKGFDKDHGVEIKLENFKAAKDRDAAFQAGKVDGVSTDLVAIAIYQEAGMDVKITGNTYGQFDLITGDDSVKTMADLKGKDVILSKKTGTEYAVTMMLEKAGLTDQDINMSEVPQVPTRLELLKNNQAQAAILPEPFATMATADGLRVLNSTRKIGINPFVMGMPQDVIEKKADAIKGMYEAYNEAVDYIKDHDKSDYIQLFIDEVGFPETLKDQIIVPDYTHAEQATDEDITSAFAWAKEHDLLTKDLQPKDVLSNVYFK